MPHPKIQGSFFYKFYTYSSLTLKQLAAITPPEHEVELIDEKFKKINFSSLYDLVGISNITCNAPRTYEVADEFRRRGVTVVLGGYHPTAMPEEAKQHADSVVIGEAEESLPQLISDLENNVIKPFYYSNSLVDPGEIPSANHNIKTDSSFSESVQATRGCPNQCKFCAIRTVEGNKFRARPIEDVIEELKTIKKHHIFFADASLTINPKYSKALFQEMKEIDKKFDCCGNINVLARDDEFLKLASEAGCSMIQIGFESVSQNSINDVCKTTNKVKDYMKAVKKIKDHNIMVMGLFVFGFDTDTPKVINSTLGTIDQLEIDRAFFSILTPLPGTPIYMNMKKTGRIFTYDWSRYNTQAVVFYPKNMSPEELQEKTRIVVKEFHSFKNLIKRSYNDPKFSLNRFIDKGIRNFSSRQYYKTLGVL
jgi:radical SAM superfamily enzyme YgiQ (UPF0313 family)